MMFIFNFVPGKHESIVAAGWTIGVEMVFYAVLPVLFLTIGRLRHALLFLLCAFIISVVARMQFVAAGGILEEYAHFAFVTSLGVFATGVFAFWGYRSVRRVSSEGGNPGRLRYVEASIVLACVGLFLFLVSTTGASLLTVGRADILVWALLFGVVLMWQALFPLRLLASVPMEFLGERSYSVYLLHRMVIFGLTPVNQRLYGASAELIGPWAFVVCAALTLAVVVACSAATYRFIEVPGIQAGRAVIAWARRRRQGVLKQFEAGDTPEKTIQAVSAR
jgi:peptidoglycan/LPS O-acetylase OafA/YrhL